MATPREIILAALHARLSVLPAPALRGDVLPERVPAEGLLILRDGEPGEPEVTLSPLAYHYQHRAEIEAVVQGADRDATFDALTASIGTALAADRTLGGLCNWVEARRITVDTTRIALESFPMAVPPEEAERRCRRALMEAWVGRETAAFRLPPSRLALDPADVIGLDHEGRLVDLRLVSIADAGARGIEAVRQDRVVYDLPPGDARPVSLSRAVVFGAPDALLMDLPQLTEDLPAHRPLVAAHAVPWPGEMAVFRSPATDGFELLTTFGSRARIGTLVSDFYAGPTSRFDLGNALVVDLALGTLESVTDLTLFGGSC